MQAAPSKLSSIEVSAQPSPNSAPGQEEQLHKNSLPTARTQGVEKSGVDTSAIAQVKLGVATVKSIIGAIKNHFKVKEQQELSDALKTVDIRGILDNSKDLERQAILLCKETVAALTKGASQIHSSMGGLASVVQNAGFRRLVDDKHKFSKIDDLLEPLGMNAKTYSKEKVDQIDGGITRPQVKEIIKVAKEVDTNRVKTATAMEFVHKIATETFSDISKLKEQVTSNSVIKFVTSNLESASTKFGNAVSYHITNPDAKESELVSAKNEFIAAYQKAIEEGEDLLKSCKIGLDSYNKANLMMDDLNGKNEVSKEPQMSVDRESSGKVYVKISPKLGEEIAKWVDSYTKEEREKFAAKGLTLEERAQRGAALASKMEEVDNAIQKLGAVLAKSHATCVEGTKDNLSALDRLLQLDPTEDKDQATAACQGILLKMQADTEAHILGILRENLKEKVDTTPAHFEQMAKQLAFTTKAVDLLEIHVRPEGKVFSWAEIAKEAKDRVDQGFAALRKKEDEVVVSADLRKLADKVFAPEKKETTFTIPKFLGNFLRFFGVLGKKE